MQKQQPKLEDRAASFVAQLRQLIAARYSIVSVQTHEEERLERLLAALAQRLFNKPIPLYLWSVTEGLHAGEVQNA